MSTYNRSLHTGRRAPVLRFSLAALGLAGALALAAPGHAQSPTTATPVTPAVAPASAERDLSLTNMGVGLPQLLERLTQQGYRDIREIERKSNKLVEVKARNAAGLPVEIYVDSRSGEVLREKFDK